MRKSYLSFENYSLVFFVSLKDALFFLKDFFTSLATEVEFFSPPTQEGKINYEQVHENAHNT